MPVKSHRISLKTSLTRSTERASPVATIVQLPRERKREITPTTADVHSARNGTCTITANWLPELMACLAASEKRAKTESFHGLCHGSSADPPASRCAPETDGQHSMATSHSNGPLSSMMYDTPVGSPAAHLGLLRQFIALWFRIAQARPGLTSTLHTWRKWRGHGSVHSFLLYLSHMVRPSFIVETVEARALLQPAPGSRPRLPPRCPFDAAFAEVL